MKRIFTTTLRLDLTDDEDRRAWAYLKQMDKKQHRSYSKAIVMAVNEYFERLENLESDPYLETREKEDGEKFATSLRNGGNFSCRANHFGRVRACFRDDEKRFEKTEGALRKSNGFYERNKIGRFF